MRKVLPLHRFQAPRKEFPLASVFVMWFARRILRRLARMILLFYVFSLAGLYACQRQIQYQPGHDNPAPASVGLRHVTVERLVAPDGVNLVLWYAAPAPGRPSLLFFQGNAGTIADRAPRLAYYQSRGFGAAFLSYRGFGGSGGQISEAGLLSDARTAYDWLAARTAPGRIVLVGESLGTGVAVQLAARLPAGSVGAVVLDAPYASTLEVAKGRFPYLPVGLLMKDKFLSIDHIAAIHAPLFIQHGTADQVVPYASGQELFAAAVEPKTFLPLPGRGHEIIAARDVWQREAQFIIRTLK